jgi:hypothetical protein
MKLMSVYLCRLPSLPVHRSPPRIGKAIYGLETRPRPPLEVGHGCSDIVKANGAVRSPLLQIVRNDPTDPEFVVAVALAVFWQTRYPLLFLLFPPLVAALFRFRLARFTAPQL